MSLWNGLVMLLAAALASACATPLSEAEDKANLEQRVLARWEAVIAGDYDRAYAFASPSYRRVYSKQHFFNQYARQLKQEGVKIVKIEFQNPQRTAARVALELTYSTLGFGPQPVFRNTAYLKETWVKEDGQWWRVETR